MKLSSRSSLGALAGVVRVRPIGLPQPGHRCFGIRLSPPIREMLTFKADRAVMAVTIERDFWRVTFAFAIWS